jgi:hypothetical protein
MTSREYILLSPMPSEDEESGPSLHIRDRESYKMPRILEYPASIISAIASLTYYDHSIALTAQEVNPSDLSNITFRCAMAKNACRASYFDTCLYFLAKWENKPNQPDPVTADYMSLFCRSPCLSKTDETSCHKDPRKNCQWFSYFSSTSTEPEASGECVPYDKDRDFRDFLWLQTKLLSEPTDTATNGQQAGDDQHKQQLKLDAHEKVKNSFVAQFDYHKRMCDQYSLQHSDACENYGQPCVWRVKEKRCALDLYALAGVVTKTEYAAVFVARAYCDNLGERTEEECLGLQNLQLSSLERDKTNEIGKYGIIVCLVCLIVSLLWWCRLPKVSHNETTNKKRGAIVQLLNR